MHMIKKPLFLLEIMLEKISYYEGKYNAYQRTYVIDTSNKSVVDLKYLYYALKLCLSDFRALSQGTSTKFLTVKILNKYIISLPDICVQKEIEKILTLIDDKIDLNNKINDNLALLNKLDERVSIPAFKNCFHINKAVYRHSFIRQIFYFPNKSA